MFLWPRILAEEHFQRHRIKHTERSATCVTTTPFILRCTRFCLLKHTHSYSTAVTFSATAPNKLQISRPLFFLESLFSLRLDDFFAVPSTCFTAFPGDSLRRRDYKVFSVFTVRAEPLQLKLKKNYNNNYKGDNRGGKEVSRGGHTIAGHFSRKC